MRVTRYALVRWSNSVLTSSSVTSAMPSPLLKTSPRSHSLVGAKLAATALPKNSAEWVTFETASGYLSALCQDIDSSPCKQRQDTMHILGMQYPIGVRERSRQFRDRRR